MTEQNYSICSHFILSHAIHDACNVSECIMSVLVVIPLPKTQRLIRLDYIKCERATATAPFLSRSSRAFGSLAHRRRSLALTRS
jgi:hypothetical protein